MKHISIEHLHYAGFIVKPSGFKGDVIIALETMDTDEFPATDFVFLKLEGLPVPFRISGRQVKNGNLVLKLEDVDSENDAKRISGNEIYLDTALLPENPEPSFDELEGFDVHDEQHGSLGKIISIEELPMQFIATCSYRGKEVLFPLNESIVLSVDPENRAVNVRLPEGLLDVYLEEDDTRPE